MTDHFDPTPHTTWETIVDQCTERIETVQRSMADGDWTALAGLEWIEPPPGLGVPSGQVRERLQRLLDLSHTLQRRVAAEMHAVRDELSRGPQHRRASRAYLRAAPTIPQTPPPG